MRLLLRNIRFNLQYTLFHDKIINMKTSAVIKVNKIFLISIRNSFSMYLYCVGLCTLRFIEEDVVKNISIFVINNLCFNIQP